jgi:hypothetical protein
MTVRAFAGSLGVNSAHPPGHFFCMYGRAEWKYCRIHGSSTRAIESQGKELMAVSGCIGSALRHAPWRLLVHDSPKGQIDSRFANARLFWNFMPALLLSLTGHDQQAPVGQPLSK